MRKLILFLLVFVSAKVSAQVYQEMPQYGYRANRMAFDSTLQIPTVCGVPTLKSNVTKKSAIAFDSCNNKLYRYNPKTLTWAEVSGGSGTTPGLQDVLNTNETSYNKSIYLYDSTNGNTYKGIKLNSNGGSQSGGTEIFLSGVFNNTGLVLEAGNDSISSVRPKVKFLNNIDDSPTTLTVTPSIGSGNIFNLPPFNVNNLEEDTLATLADVRNAGGTTIDTTNQFVKRLDRTPGKDSIIYFVGANRFAIKDSVGTNPAPVGYYGAFQDTTTQTAASINTAYGVKLGVTDLSNGVTIANNTRIKIANAGIYNIQFSLQLEKTGGSGNMIADIWLRKNGVNLDGTTGKVVLTGSANASPVVAAWNYVIAVSSGDSLELMWATSNDNIVIKATSATAPHPSIPSAILTVTQQSGIMAGTGISPLDTSNMLLPYLRKIDTASLSNRINLKLNANDTTSLSNRINSKLNITDANQTISAFQYLGSSIKFFPIGVNSFIQATTNLQFISTRIFITAIYVPTTTTVTGVKWVTGSAGSSYIGGANYNGIALYSYNVGSGLCIRIDSTASDANIWATTGFQSKAFVTSISLPQGVYYLAAICNGTATTFPSITQTAAQSTVTTYDFTSPAKLTGNSAGTVSPASFNLSTITSTTNTPVIALY
jgi:hypothetical protein